MLFHSSISILCAHRGPIHWLRYSRRVTLFYLLLLITFFSLLVCLLSSLLFSIISFPDLTCRYFNATVYNPKGVRLVVSKFQWGSCWRMLLPGMLFCMLMYAFTMSTPFCLFSWVHSTFYFISFHSCSTSPHLRSPLVLTTYIMFISPRLCAFLGLVQLPWSRIGSRSRDSIRSGCRGGCFAWCLPRYRGFRKRLDSWGKLT